MFRVISTTCRTLVTAIALTALAACTGMGLGPTGPATTLNPADIERAASNNERIMAALAADAGIGRSGPAGWYDITLAGYNFIDDECSDYFGQLFRLERERESAKTGLAAFGQTTNAIMQITGVAQITISVVAQLFGLASSATDIVAGTFLYDLPPATTKSFLDEVVHAYKDGTSAHRGEIDSSAAAYSFIRGYLELCLPVKIEALLVDHVAAARATADGGATGASLAIRVGTEQSVADIKTDIIVNARTSLQPVVVPPTPAGKNALERQMPDWQWREIQNALCIVPDGSRGEATHNALHDFFTGRGEPRPDVLTAGIVQKDLDLLLGVVAEAKGKDCKTLGRRDAFQVGQLSQ